MKITEENYIVILKAKQKNLFKAQYRVEELLEKYKKDLPTWEIRHSWDYNLLHDLMHRIEDRINENYQVCCDWNWKVHGFNIIDIGN